MIEFSALQSRFGKRLFMLFVGLALVPICTLALITYGSVGRELGAASDERLKGLTKTVAMSLLERLALIDEQLTLLAESSLRDPAEPSNGVLERASRPRFKRLTWVPADGAESRGRAFVERPSLTLDERLHLSSGRMLLAIRGDAEPFRILVARQAHDEKGTALGEIWGEVEPRYLWWGIHGENHLPPLTELCVVQASLEQTLFCSSGEPAGLSDVSRESMLADTFGDVMWRRGGESHRAHFRSLWISELYGHYGFTVILSEAMDRSRAPLRDFRLSFLPIILATLWVVVLLSIRQIRGRLAPLERLRAGTREIALRNFDANVEISSGDEFEELAESFNRMGRRLGRQFRSLSALSSIQSAVLSAHDEAEVAVAVLEQLAALLPNRDGRVVVLNRRTPGFCRIYGSAAASETGAGPEATSEERLLSAVELRWLKGLSDIVVLEDPESLPRFLDALGGSVGGAVLVVPIIVDASVVGAVATRLEDDTVVDEDDLGPVRQLGDQIAMALSKTALIGKLRELSVGTMAALARTIDANSRWTLGHSERVSDLAVRLGRALELPAVDIDVLERGALLHDIGKLGVPASVLDKPSRLTADEMHQVRQHVTIGVNILKPVPSLADTLPLVEQHHEWFDGSGYPFGLAGDQIHPLARLLSVVDCYDALRSARPYRGALEEDEVRRHLREQAGRQFDPVMVEAFLGLLEESDRDRSEGRRVRARGGRTIT